MIKSLFRKYKVKNGYENMNYELNQMLVLNEFTFKNLIIKNNYT